MSNPAVSIISAINKIPDLEARIASLTAENERLREALAFYADKNNWRSSRFYIGGQPGNSKAQNDRGAKALAAAEAKPGLVWVRHDGSGECPIDINQPVLITNINRFYGEGLARAFYWNRVTHYAVITPPGDVA